MSQLNNLKLIQVKNIIMPCNTSKNKGNTFSFIIFVDYMSRPSVAK